MDPQDYPEVRAPDMYDEDVMMLASGNFEREIKRAFMMLIFFYKDNCERCKKVIITKSRGKSKNTNYKT